MNLTYEVNGTGYTIFDNGVAWFKQDSYIPYPGATVEESAQNHINTILTEQEQQQQGSTEIEQLKQSQAEQDALIMQLLLGGA